MLISKNWLQNYFKEKLPSTEKLADFFTFHSCEVEGVEKKGDDDVLDLKILPDRAHYALSHRGVAYEVQAMTGLKMQERAVVVSKNKISTKIEVKITEPLFCRRYSACLVENISIKESPKEFKQKLEAIGERSINNIVDATNVTMFDCGQPLHAFDADLVRGAMIVRKAKNGEKIQTLDGKEITLDDSILVIADEEGALAIAGIKGGKKAEVTARTKRIILESANFEPAMVRRASVKIGVRTESSKRFENEITPHLTEIALSTVLSFLAQILPETAVGPITDIHGDLPKPTKIILPKDFIARRLGAEVTESEILKVFKQLDFEVADSNKGGKKESNYEVTVPLMRLDLTIPEDLVEEFGRIYGYDKIPAVELPEMQISVGVNKQYYYSEKIKNILTRSGFSEVMTYSLGKKGDFEVAYPVSKDKDFLRTNLTDNLEKSLETNVRNAPILNLKQIRQFEIGNVFGEEGESLSLVIGIMNAEKSKIKEADELKKVLQNLGEALGIDLIAQKTTAHTIEVDLGKIISDMPKPKMYDEVAEISKVETKYKKISPYPFIVRDVAVFVPKLVAENEVAKIVEKESGPLKVRIDLFDVFTKKFPDGEEKTSYAFRLVFQSPERTLIEEEVNAVMKKVSDALSANKNWQVR